MGHAEICLLVISAIKDFSNFLQKLSSLSTMSNMDRQSLRQKISVMTHQHNLADWVVSNFGISNTV